MSNSDPIKKSYERAFTGCNRTSLSWAAYQAGWNAAKNGDQVIYDSITARYFRDTAAGEPSRSPVANCPEPPGSPAEQLRCPVCEAKPGQEHAPACPRHPSDPMGVRRR